MTEISTRPCVSAPAQGGIGGRHQGIDVLIIQPKGVRYGGIDVMSTPPDLVFALALAHIGSQVQIEVTRNLSPGRSGQLAGSSGRHGVRFRRCRFAPQTTAERFELFPR